MSSSCCHVIHSGSVFNHVDAKQWRFDELHVKAFKKLLLQLHLKTGFWNKSEYTELFSMYVEFYIRVKYVMSSSWLVQLLGMDAFFKNCICLHVCTECMYMYFCVRLQLLHLQNPWSSSMVIVSTWTRVLNIIKLVKTFPRKAALAHKVSLFCCPDYSKRVREWLFDAVPSSAS